MDSGLTQSEQRLLIQRVASSSGFANAHTIRALFLYIANHTIEGQFDQLKEQQIGSQVLRRKPDYNPADDNIVRVRIRELRHKLEEYFSNEGKSESYVITIPKGAYVAAFTPRETEAPLPSLEPISIPVDHKPNSTTAWWILGIAIAAITGYALSFILHANSFSRQQGGKDARLISFWAPLLEKKELTVVAADSGFALWQDFTHQTFNLSEYVNRAYLKPVPATPTSLEIVTRRSTSTADLAAAARLAEIAEHLGAQTSTQFARDLSIQDLRNKNVVLSGSRRSNPWVELFEPKMNFVLADATDAQGPTFKNKVPQVGESPTYSIAGKFEIASSARNAIVSYAIVALMPNLSSTGYVLILEGLNMEGSEAALAVVTNPEKLASLQQRVGRAPGPPRPFEALVKLTAFAGAAANIEIVAHRAY